MKYIFCVYAWLYRWCYKGSWYPYLIGYKMDLYSTPNPLQWRQDNVNSKSNDRTAASGIVTCQSVINRYVIEQWFHTIQSDISTTIPMTLQWRHNGLNGVSNHQPRDCLLNRLFRRRSKKTSKLRVTGLCAGNSTVTGEFPAQMASNTENASIWWRHHGVYSYK